MNNRNSNRIKSQEIQIGSSYILPIEQSRVTQQQAKVQKIIQETDNKAQEILSVAENKSQIIVQTANTEATTIIENARKKAEQEYETIKAQAYEESFKKGEHDGFYKFQTDAISGLKYLDTLASCQYDMKKNIIDSASRDIVDLVIAISHKVCNEKFNDKILHNITLNAIKQLNDKENITIIVNPELIESINSLVNGFRTEVSNLQNLKILEDNSLSADGVIVETPNTRLDCRISSQIEEIAHQMLTGADEDDLG